jgi:hypothetical protein
MSPFDLSAGQSQSSGVGFGGVGFAPMSGAPGPDVKWIRPDRPAYLAPPTARSDATERSERANAMIVICLTLACTVLALYDLFLLAAGV